jgi:hypothetical protein
MAQYKVLKEFDYAHDGVKTKHQKKGDTPHVRDALVEGLKAEGFIGDLDAKAAKAAAAAPADPDAAAAAEAEAKAKAEAEAAAAKK